MVDMRHQRHADLVGDLQRDVERRRALVAGGVLADPHLDADDHVAVRVRDLGRLLRRHHAGVLALADHDGVREGVDAGKGDVQIGEDARLARAR